MFMLTTWAMAITVLRIISAPTRISIRAEDQSATLTIMITIARAVRDLDASEESAHSHAKRTMHPIAIILLTRRPTIAIHQANRLQRAIMDKVIQLQLRVQVQTLA